MAKSPRYYRFSSVPRVSQQGHCHLTGVLCAPSSSAMPTPAAALQAPEFKSRVMWGGCGDPWLPQLAHSLEISGCPLVCRSTELLHFTRWDNSCLQFWSRVLNAPCLKYFGYCGRAAPGTHHKAHPQGSVTGLLLPSQWAAAQINRTRETCALQTEKISILALSVNWGLDLMLLKVFCDLNDSMILWIAASSRFWLV